MKTLLEKGGFEYIVDQFLAAKVSTQSADSLADRLELKQLSIIVALLRMIFAAAFKLNN